MAATAIFMTLSVNAVTVSMLPAGGQDAKYSRRAHAERTEAGEGASGSSTSRALKNPFYNDELRERRVPQGPSILEMHLPVSPQIVAADIGPSAVGPPGNSSSIETMPKSSVAIMPPATVSSSDVVSSRIWLLLSMPETIVRWSLPRCDQRHNFP